MTVKQYLLLVIGAGLLSTSGAATVEEELAALGSNHNIRIHYTFDPSTFFPAQWHEPAVSVTGTQIAPADALRLIPVIEKFLSDHPRSVIEQTLKDIYLLGYLACGGKEYGSTYEGSSIFLPCRGVEFGYTEPYLEERLHSEFSSLLMKRHTFPRLQWKALNDTGFTYSGTGFEVIDDPQRYQAKEVYQANGFLLKYSQSSLENDFNMISAWMFTHPAELDSVCRKFPRLQQKHELAKGFYSSVSTEYIFP